MSSGHVTPSNSMTLVDRVAERLKNSEVGVFITEDELTEIGREAIQKAFFSNRVRATDGYGRSEPLEPLVVELARSAFKPVFERRVADIVDHMTTQPEFQQALQEVAVSLLPDLLLNYGRRLAMETVGQAARNTVVSLQERLRDGAIGAPYHHSDNKLHDGMDRIGTEGKTLPPV